MRQQDLRKPSTTLKRGLIASAMLAFFVAVLVSAFPPPHQAQAQGVPGNPMVATGYCQLATLTTSIGLASCSGGIPAGSTAALVRIEAQAGRYRTDGSTTAPTAAVGMPILVADAPLLLQGNLTALRFIESTAGGKLNVTFYKAR